MEQINVLVSACLLGVDCKYSGGNNKTALDLPENIQLIPVCPEQFGGLPTPRTPSERVGEKVLGNNGKDRTEAFQKGAEESLKLAKLFGCKLAILKERSPSCGSTAVYDGSFTGTVVPGQGVTAELLEKHGITVLSEENYKEYFE